MSLPRAAFSYSNSVMGRKPAQEAYAATSGQPIKLTGREGLAVEALEDGLAESQAMVLRLTTPSEFFPPKAAAVRSRRNLAALDNVLKKPTHSPSVNSYFIK